MNDNVESSSYELRQLFPKMQPVKSAPSLFSLNGFGVSMYGKRDVHPPTGSYIKTYCLCGLFVPVLALSAYRVVDAEGGGWYFLGKEPLSGFAKSWNYLLLGAILVLSGAAWWSATYNTPEARAKRTLTQAHSARSAGQPAKAARLFTKVYTGPTLVKHDAVKGFQALFAGLPQMSPKQAVQVLTVLREAQERGDNESRLPKFSLSHTYDKVVALVKAKGASDPASANRLLELVQEEAPNPAALRDLRRSLLVKAVAQRPKDPELASALARLYEREKKTKAVLALLAPLKDKLGDREGARILGQVYLRKGRYKEAFALLRSYTQPRLKKLHRAEKRYQKATQAAHKRAVRRLRLRLAPRFFYSRSFRELSRSERRRRVSQYVRKQVREDARVRSRRRDLVAAARVVPVAMDLGVVQLHQARRIKNRAARQRELKAAERTFLSIRGMAGRSNRFKLYLGQVYYWMGKPAKGQALFNDVLKRSRRSFRVLMRMTSILRELGEHSRAKKLAEEAYRKAKKKQDKHNAAYLRSLTGTDLEEKVRWLKRADPESLRVEISLNSARGRLARREGQYAKAARYLKKAIAGYKQLPKNPSSLNNRALVHFSLFRVTGDKSHYKQGLTLVKEALSMRPSDSIMLGNAAYFHLQQALIETVGQRIDWRTLHQSVDIGLLGYFYKEQKGKDALLQTLQAHPGFAKAVALDQKLLILAPKSRATYHSLSRIYWHTRNRKGMHDLLERLQEGKFRFLDRLRYRRTAKSRREDRRALGRTKRAIALQGRLLRRARRSRVAYAVAAVTRVQFELAAFALGAKVKGRSLVRLAERAYRRHSSAATRQSLIRALLFRTGEVLARRHQKFARLREANKRWLTGGYILAYAVVKDASVRRRLRRNRSLRKALKLMRDSVRAFPSHGYASEWALFHAFDDSMAKVVAQRLSNDALLRSYDKIRQILSPNSPSLALKAYFAALATGQSQDKARAVLKAFHRRGAPLPSLAKGVVYASPPVQNAKDRSDSRKPGSPRRKLQRDTLGLRGSRLFERRKPASPRRSVPRGGNFLGGGDDDSELRAPRRRKPAPRRRSTWLE